MTGDNPYDVPTIGTVARARPCGCKVGLLSDVETIAENTRQHAGSIPNPWIVVPCAAHGADLDGVCAASLNEKQAVIELYGKLLGELFPGLRASGSPLEHATSIVAQIRKRLDAARIEEPPEVEVQPDLTLVVRIAGPTPPLGGASTWHVRTTLLGALAIARALNEAVDRLRDAAAKLVSEAP